MKTLIVEEFEITEELSQEQLKDHWNVGDKFTHFKDPETGKLYQPKKGFMVTAKDGGDLSDRFEEIGIDGGE
ncbi:MAG: hypothetical protein ACPG5T_00010 [Endozoicomonas sp.]